MKIHDEAMRSITFIRETFKNKGFTKAIIGISGGIDSAVVASLCCRALGAENVYGYALPCGEQKDINDSRKIAGLLDFNYEEINIKPVVDLLCENLTDPSLTNTNTIAILRYRNDRELYRSRRGNFASRTRANILYDKSAEHNGLVVGTSNLTELTLGYFTLGGDGLCAMEPIGHLYKTEVFELAKYLDIPKSIIEKAPTAGLWEGQTDEGQLGMSYFEIDAILKDIEEGKRRITRLEFSDNYRKILDIIAKNKFKLEPLPMLERK